MTHDLFKTFSDRFSIQIKEVIIHKLVDGVFFSSLVCEKEGIEEIIDTRTSDAIAIAVRFEAPIFTYENILDKAYLIKGGEILVEGTTKKISNDKDAIKYYLGGNFRF